MKKDRTACPKCGKKYTTEYILSKDHIKLTKTKIYRVLCRCGMMLDYPEDQLRK